MAFLARCWTQIEGGLPCLDAIKLGQAALPLGSLGWASRGFQGTIWFWRTNWICSSWISWRWLPHVAPTGPRVFLRFLPRVSWVWQDCHCKCASEYVRMGSIRGRVSCLGKLSGRASGSVWCHLASAASVFWGHWGEWVAMKCPKWIQMDHIWSRCMITPYIGSVHKPIGWLGSSERVDQPERR